MVKLVIDNNRYFQVAKVIEHIMLNCVDISHNKNKFYETKIEVSPDGEYRVFTRHGRVGEEGAINYRYPIGMATAYDIQEAANSLRKKKEKGGYVQIDVETETKRVSKVDVSKLDTFDRIITQIYDEAVRVVNANVQTPLGKLSIEQINRTKKVLDKIYVYLNSKSIDYSTLESLSSELYANLPQVTETRLVRLPVIDNFVKLQKQMELIKIIESLINTNGDVDKNAKEHLANIGAKMKLLTPRSKEYKRIVEWVKKSQSHHHNVDLVVKNILTLDVMGEKERFNPSKLRTTELFHGSRNANLLHILKNGLMIKPKTAVHTGSMFGDGIYFASESTKSSQYSARNSGNFYNEAYLFIADVATGRIKDYDSAQPYLHTAPQGYDSVRGVKGRQLIHDEYIVFNTNQVQLKYLIEFESRRKR